MSFEQVSYKHLSDECVGHTWYFVSNVLHTPVSNIIPTRNGITALAGMTGACIPQVCGTGGKVTVDCLQAVGTVM
jgi:hypothetical protein